MNKNDESGRIHTKRIWKIFIIQIRKLQIEEDYPHYYSNKTKQKKMKRVRYDLFLRNQMLCNQRIMNEETQIWILPNFVETRREINQWRSMKKKNTKRNQKSRSVYVYNRLRKRNVRFHYPSFFDWSNPPLFLGFFGERDFRITASKFVSSNS